MSTSCPINSPMFDKGTYRTQIQPVEPNGPQLSIVQQATTDEMLIEMWLHNRSRHTQRAYRRDVESFLEYVNKPIRHITLGDLQQYSDFLFQKNLSPVSIKRSLWAIKSMFSFAAKLHYVVFNVGLPLKLPATQNRLAERILSEEEVQTVIHSIEDRRDRLMVKTLYYTAIRASELVSIKWRDLQPRSEGGQLNVLCKGGKTNTLLIPQHLWDELMMLRDTINEDAPVFRSRKGGHLCTGHVRRLIKKYALKFINKGATCHYYRHSSASHALGHGAPIDLIQRQLNHSSLAVTSKYLHARPQEGISKFLK
jgi:site-specific recombinase XerD